MAFEDVQDINQPQQEATQSDISTNINPIINIDAAEAQDPPTKAQKLYRNLIGAKKSDGTSKYTVDDLGSEDEFSKAISDSTNADKIYSKLIADGYTTEDLGDKNEFLSTFVSKKKNGGEASQDGMADVYPSKFQSPSELPKDANGQPVPVNPQEDPNNFYNLASQANIIRNTPTSVSVSGGTGGAAVSQVVDPASKEQADKIDADIEAAGYNANKLRKDAEGINDAYWKNPEYSPTKLLKLYKENPQRYERRIATAKYGSSLFNSINADENISSEEKTRLKNLSLQYGSNIANFSNLSLEDIRGNVQSLVNIARNVSGDKTDEVLSNMYTVFAEPYASKPIDPADPLLTKLSSNQAIAYKLLQDTNPKEASNYEVLLLDPNLIDKGYLSQLSYQEKGKRLEEMGVSMKKNWALENINTNAKEYGELAEKIQNKQATQDEINRFVQIDQSLAPYRDTYNAANESENAYNKNFPLAVEKEASNYAQNFIGQDQGYFSQALGTVGKASLNVGQSLYDISVMPFLNHQEQIVKQNQLFGIPSALERFYYRTPQTDKKPELNPFVQQEMDKIVNDSTLTYDQKKKKATDLLMGEPVSEWQKTSLNELSANANTTPTSALYGITDMALGLLPFFAIEGVTGGGATPLVGRFASNFIAGGLTMFHDEYLQRVREGSKNPYADAAISTSILSAAMAVGDAPGKIRAAIDAKTPIGRMLANLSDKEIQNIVRTGSESTAYKALKGAVNLGANVVSRTGKAVSEAVGFTASTTGGEVLKDYTIYSKTKPKEEYGKDFILKSVSFAPLNAIMGGIGASLNRASEAEGGFFKSIAGDIKGLAVHPEDNITKDALFQAGLNSTEFLTAVDKGLANGTYTPDEAKQMSSNIMNANRILRSTPMLDANGNKLSLQDQRDLVFLKLQKIDAESFLQQDIHPDLASKLGDRIVGIDEQMDKIYKGVSQNLRRIQPTEVKKLTREGNDLINDAISSGKIPENEAADLTDRYKKINFLIKIAEDARAGKSQELRSKYGDEIVDHALQQNASVGEEVAVKGEEGTATLFGKASTFIPQADLDVAQSTMTKVNNNESINENEIKKTEDILYTTLDKHPEAAHLIEPLITKLQEHDNITKTETVETTERVPVEGTFAAKTKLETKPILEDSTGSETTVTLADGTTHTGTLKIKDGNYVVEAEGKEPVIIGEKAITDRDLTLPSEDRVPEPFKMDKDGNLESVTVQTRDGHTVEIKGDKALDIAIKLRAEAVGEIPDAAFDKVYEEVVKTNNIEVPVEKPKVEKKEEPKEETTQEKKEGEKTGTTKTTKTASEKIKERRERKKQEQTQGTQTTQAPGRPQSDLPPQKHNSETISSVDTKGYDETQKKVVEDAGKVLKSINNVVREISGKDAEVVLHSNDESFRKAAEKASGEKQDQLMARGFYFSPEGIIHLNMPRVTAETMKHEGFHPLLDFMAIHRPEIIDQFHNQLKGIEGGQKIIDDANRIYKGSSETTIKKEAITDFVAKVADGSIKLDKTNFEKVKDFFKSILSKLGINIGKDINSIDDLQALAKEVSQKFAKGQEIKYDKSALSKKIPETKIEDTNIQKSGNPLQFSKTVYGESGIVKEPALDDKEYKEAVKSGRISAVNPYESLEGKKFAITFPDDLFVGNIKLGDDVVAEGNGGVFYAAKNGAKGDVWAAAGEVSARNFVIQANKSLELNNGEGVITLSKGNDLKHSTSLEAKVGMLKTFLNYGKKIGDVKGVIEAIKEVYSVGNLKDPNKIIESFEAYLKGGRAESGQNMLQAKESYENFAKALVDKANPVVTDMMLKMGYSGSEYFHGTQLKKGELVATKKGVNKLFTDLFQEDFLKGVNEGAVYAALKFTSPLEYVSDPTHPSYPYRIKTKDGSPVKLEVFTKTFNAYGKEGVGIKGERAGKPESSFGVATTTSPSFEINKDMEDNPSQHNLSGSLDSYEAFKKEPQFSKEEKYDVSKVIESGDLKKNAKSEVDRIKSLPAENEDGATFNLDGTKHEGGLVVPAESLNTTQEKLTPALINDFVKNNRTKISGDNFKVGIYKFPNSNKVSIDLNIIVDPKYKDVALEFGKLAGQESLYDLDTFENLKTGATGDNPKKFTSKEFFDIAKSLSQGKMPEVAKRFEKISEEQIGKVDLIEKSGKRKEMTEDDKGNYLLFHYSNKDFKKLKPETVGTHLATGRDEKTAIPTSSFYTRPDRLEPSVPSDFGYIVKVPKEKVYPFNEDPLNLLPEAEKIFKEKNKNRSFDSNNQLAFVAKLAAEKGYIVTVADWNIKGTKTLIAKTTEPLAVERYKNIKPGTLNQTEYSKPEYADIKPNAKRKDIEFQKIDEYDKENKPGIPSSIREGEKPIETQPVKGGGAQEISSSGVLQAQGAGGEGKGVEGKVGEEVKKDKINILGEDYTDLFNKSGIPFKYLTELYKNPTGDKLTGIYRNNLLSSINNAIDFWNKEKQKQGDKMKSPESDFEFRKKMLSKYDDRVSKLNELKKQIEENLLRPSDIKISKQEKVSEEVVPEQKDKTQLSKVDDSDLNEMKGIIKEYTNQGYSLDDVKEIMKDEFGEDYDSEEPVIEQAYHELTTTGIKKEITTRERAERDLEPVEVEAKRSFGKAFDNAKKMVDNEEINPAVFAAQIAAKPRPLSAEESVILLMDRMKISKDYGIITDQMIDAQRKGDETTAQVLQSQLDVLEQRMQVNDEAAKKSGYEQGLGLAARRMLINRDYSLATQLQRMKSANGGEDIPTEKRARLQELVTKLDEANKKIEELENKNLANQVQKNISKTKKVSKSPEEIAKERTSLKNKIVNAWKSLASKVKPAATGGKVLYSKEELITPEKKAQLESISKDVKDLVKSYAEAGNTNLKSIIDDIHADISSVLPELTRKDIEDVVIGKYSKEPVKTPLTPEQIQAMANVKKVQTQIDLMKDEFKLKQRSKGEVAMDYLQGWHRLAILSGIPSLGKIATAATMRGITSRAEGVIGQGLSYIPGIRSIAKGAEREGRLSPKAEAKAFATWFDKMTMQDIKQVLKTGVGELDYLYGDKKEFAAKVPHWMEFFGRMHAAMKLLPKRAEFFRSLEMRTENAIKKGLDPMDPIVQQELTVGAYNDALRAVFMQDNYVTDAYKAAVNNLEKSTIPGAKETANALKFIFPIVKVPTNYVAEESSYMIGGLKALYALRKGVSNMTPEQKDFFMRAMKKQTIGLGFMFLGYLNPQALGGYYSGKRKEGDLEAGEIELFGKKLPHWMSHSPLLEMLQVGATIRRASDAEVLKGNEPSMVKGIPTVFKGVIKQIPLFGGAGRIEDAFQNGDKFTDYLAGLGTSITEPQLLQNISDWTDTEEGKTIKRLPSGVGEKFMEGTPFRSKLEAKKELFTKDDMEDKGLSLLQDKGVEIPFIRERRKIKVAQDESHPEGIMTPEEYDTYAEKLNKKLKSGIKEVLNTQYQIKEGNKYSYKMGKDLEGKDLESKVKEKEGEISSSILEEMKISPKSKRQVTKLD